MWPYDHSSDTSGYAKGFCAFEVSQREHQGRWRQNESSLNEEVDRKVRCDSIDGITVRGCDSVLESDRCYWLVTLRQCCQCRKTKEM